MGNILEVRNISKKFQISHNQQRYLNFRDSLSSLFMPSKSSTETFYAVNDVSFNVKEGDSIGLIGKNGAGKSTLLKILSKITPPTSGSITCRGRIASLLEVGTGFHQELSGRENIFLNGSILGMKRKEIQLKFDEIVDFSGVENFLDTPLKHYSSGMQLRLAFSVAAHLDPEILLIDEVLAVGDAEFQKKCLGKMQEVSGQGRTVLFVSHNMPSIRTLCSTAIVMEHGKVIGQGDVNEMITQYLSTNLEKTETHDGLIPENLSRRNTGEAKFRQAQLFSLDNEVKKEFYFNEQFMVKIRLELFQKLENVNIWVFIVNSYGENVLMAVDNESYKPCKYEKGMHTFTVKFMEELMPGDYSIGLVICHFHTGFSIDYVDSFYPFKVIKETKDNLMEYPWTKVFGVVRPKTEWKWEAVQYK